MKEIKLAGNAESDPAAQDSDGWTPLHGAALDGHVEAIKDLLDAGADPNSKNRDDKTPLHWALRGAHAEAIAAREKTMAGPRALKHFSFNLRPILRSL